MKNYITLGLTSHICFQTCAIQYEANLLCPYFKKREKCKLFLQLHWKFLGFVLFTNKYLGSSRMCYFHKKALSFPVRSDSSSHQGRTFSPLFKKRHLILTYNNSVWYSFNKMTSAHFSFWVPAF